MTPFDEYHQRQIAEAIARAERRTDAELVTVLARRADDYAYWPLLWAAVLALAVPGLLHWLLGWPSVRGLLVANVLLFVGLCLLLRNPRLAGWLIPHALRRWRASRWPDSSFASRTCSAPQAHGCADFCQRGGAACGDPGRPRYRALPGRRSPRGHRSALCRTGAPRPDLARLCRVHRACGELLSQHVPPTHARNELPNRLVILD